jgi:hypothetical protein
MGWVFLKEERVKAFKPVEGADELVFEFVRLSCVTFG